MSDVSSATFLLQQTWQLTTSVSSDHCCVDGCLSCETWQLTSLVSQSFHTRQRNIEKITVALTVWRDRGWGKRRDSQEEKNREPEEEKETPSSPEIHSYPSILGRRGGKEEAKEDVQAPLDSRGRKRKEERRMRRRSEHLLSPGQNWVYLISSRTDLQDLKNSASTERHWFGPHISRFVVGPVSTFLSSFY